MNHASLFSGIGGFDLAARRLGWNNVFHCEIDPFALQILKYYFPKSISYENIKETKFTKHKNQIDILSGGFPCQPFSHAGRRKGTDDPRNLWPEMYRAIQEIQPTYIVAENVLGIIDWSDGLVFEQIVTQMESESYQVQAYIIPAAGVNAPHRRYRVWIIAYSDLYASRRKSKQNNLQEKSKKIQKRNKIQYAHEPVEIQESSDATCYGGLSLSKNTEQKRKPAHSRIDTFNQFHQFPSFSPFCSGDDGIPTELDGITFSKWRAESIKTYGNAIIPQIAYNIFKTIHFYNQKNKS